MALESTPVGSFRRTSRPPDPIGKYYPVRDGDFGIHLFMAPARTRIPGFTGAVFESLRRLVFAEPSRQRIVIEPDARNEGALRRWQRLGFEFGDRVELPHKTAQLAFLSRLPHTA
jgi:RimJ/RimL family protein N-acetyltransferase